MQNIADALVLAVAHQRAGRLGAAETLYRAVLDEEPRQPSALFLYGLLKLGGGRYEAAATLLDAAASQRPHHPGALLALARARLSSGNAGAALLSADRALALDAGSAVGHFLRGTALNALGRPAEAAASLRRAVALEPSDAAAHLNLGNACADLDDLGEAERLCRVAVALDPALAEAQASLGFILTSRGKLAEASAACEAAIRLRPDFAQAHWNRAMARLLAGDFATGFAEYEWRKRHDRFRRDFLDLPGPRWEGEALDGARILVTAEQGLGDTIQLSRYIPLLAERGGRVLLACDKRLIPLLAGSRGLEEAVEKGTTLPTYDRWVDQMSLPRLLGTEVGTVPLPDGYLRAEPARAAGWKARIGAGRRIGVAWAGNPAHSNDRRRSLSAGMLAALLEAPGVDFVSLQVGPRSGEATAIAGLADLAATLTDYAETAALISALDLVITVDTSVAHLAGALGRPVWVMLPYAPDWRWMLGRDDTPWYRSMRLFRQNHPGNWPSVIAEIRHALEGWGSPAP